MVLSDAWVDFIAGWCSGGSAVIACQPVDTVLTRYQAGAHLVQGASSGTAGNVLFRPSFVARGLVSQAGVKSLWRGSSAMIGAVPMQNALLMSGYGAGKRWSEDWSEEHGTRNRNALFGVFIGGCTGGVVQSFLMSPVELIKVTQQVAGKGVLPATFGVASGLLSSNGWRGLNATILRDGIPHGVWFASYEWAKTYLEGQRTVSSNSDKFTIPLVSGAFAATTAWGVGYPADLIKTRIQAGGKQSILGTGRELIQEAGGRPLPGLYRGFGLKLLRAVPASAIGFMVYEFVKKEISPA